MDEKTKALLKRAADALKNKPVDSHEVSIQLKEPKSTQTLIDEVKDTKTGIKGFLGEILTAIRAIKLKPADVNIHTPKEVEIKKPSWISETFSFKRIHDALENIEEAVKKEKPYPKPDFPHNPENPISVRLSDGKAWIEQLTNTIVETTSGVSIPKVTATADGLTNVIAVPVVNPDGSNIGGGSGTAAYSNGAGTTKQGLVDADRHVQVDVLTMPAVSIDTTGLALESKQDTQITHLAAIEAAVEGTIAVSNAGLTELAAAINASSQVDVNIAAGNITGFATSAKQDTIIGHLDGVETSLGNIDTDLTTIIGHVDGIEALLAGSLTVDQATAGDLNMVAWGWDGSANRALATDSSGNVQVDIVDQSPADVDVTAHTNYIKKYYTNAGAVTDGIIWSPAAGKRWHVTSLFIQVSAAATVTLEDDLGAGDSAVLKMELAANSGISIPFSEMYPLASGEDAADLIITTSAGNVYVTAVGYEI